jgi:hypothetical protein
MCYDTGYIIIVDITTSRMTYTPCLLRTTALNYQPYPENHHHLAHGTFHNHKINLFLLQTSPLQEIRPSCIHMNLFASDLLRLPCATKQHQESSNFQHLAYQILE